ncbi:MULTISPECIES: phosphomannomutase/phosphoglucomutase [Thioalkalivibrio]|uniref:phosphomannomutase/phosphoglucomutase n=1 Tax=Thioalkalivibrio TaxID=106633 RepID=UPI000373902E|nr:MULTISPECIES: phosphomannomutase/phosphoglucomutase [Thioalkalivibrio]OOC50709.1 phosphomannomutase/phosphoglucomutase [Thioalkalivibrio versutus]
MKIDCFKAYDIRGRVPDQLNPDVVRAIGRAFAEEIRPGRTVVGHDIRLSSPELARALTEGLTAGGSDVADIGMCGTEEVYFATAHYGAGGGIMVTASHNPLDYNGLKLVRSDARPISGDSGLQAIRVCAERGDFRPMPHGQVRHLDHRADYISRLLASVDRETLPKLKVVVNPGNGGAGPVLEALEPHLPFELIRVNFEPDGRFPNGIPNPLLPENRAATAEAVRKHGADLGVAWDGDFDRCFLFDAQGNFIEGYYIVGLLAEACLEGHAGERIVHDPRLTWNTIEMVCAAGGEPIQSKTGHAFMKERLRHEDGIYGGEMSAHHYFRDFYYCDTGMLPWLRVAELMGRRGQALGEMVAERMARFPCSGELNFEVEDAAAATDRVMQAYASEAVGLDHTDGVSLEFADWRFNLRSSNTEPLLRLNVETRADPALLERRVDEISRLIRG